MRRLARIADGLTGQPMFRLLARAGEMERAGQRIYHFEIGDASFRAHQHLIDATKDALDADQTHYVNSRGIPELREAIRDHMTERLGFRPDMEQILVMPANAIIDVCMRVVADPGDDVVFPDPGFSTYIAVSDYTGIRKVGFPLREANQFRMEAAEIARCITDRTRLLIVNSPSNPTGAITPDEEIERIAQLAAEKDLYLLSDEIYSGVTYEGVTPASPAGADACRERTIILNGFAKNYAMPGWRLGYAVGPHVVIQKMAVLFETMYSCLPAFIQAAGVAALRGDQAPIDERRWCYEIFRNQMVDKLNEMPGVSCVTPEGACYVFPNITGTGMTSLQFAEFALEKAGVALLPGTCFGENGEGYVRICYTCSGNDIEVAMERLKMALRERVEQRHEVFAG